MLINGSVMIFDVVFTGGDKSTADLTAGMLTWLKDAENRVYRSNCRCPTCNCLSWLDDFWNTDTSSSWFVTSSLYCTGGSYGFLRTAQPWNHIEQLWALSGMLLLSSSVVQERSRNFCMFSCNMRRCLFCTIHAKLELVSLAAVKLHCDNLKKFFFFFLGFLEVHNKFCSTGLDWNFCNNRKLHCFYPILSFLY